MKNKWVIFTAVLTVMIILSFFYSVFAYTTAITLSLGAIYGVTIFWLYWSSRQGLPRNRTFVTECPFKYAMITKRGSRPLKVITGGRVQYDKNFTLINSAGKHLELEKNGRVIDLDSFIKTPNANQKGISWIGIPWIDRVTLFHFEWNDLEEISTGEKTIKQIKHMKTTDPEGTEFFSVYKTFGFIAEGLEIGFDKSKTPDSKSTNMLDKLRVTYARIPIDMTFALTILIVDASKAICTLNWYKGLSGMIRQKCLIYCGDHSIDEIIDDSGEKLNRFIIKLNKEILDKFGVVITKSSYIGFRFSGTEEERKKMEDNVQKVWLAEQDKLVKMQAADASAYEITKKADAEATAIKATANATAHKIDIEGEATAKAQKALYDGIGEKNALPHAIATTQAATLVLGNAGIGLNLPPKS